MPEHECVWSSINGQGKLCCPVCSTVAENQPFKEPETCRTCNDVGYFGRKGQSCPLECASPTHNGQHWTDCPDCTQPAPKHGAASEPVEDTFAATVDRVIVESYSYGIRKYGVPLHTFDGRDQDMEEEWVSLGRYFTKVKMERNHLAELLRRADALLEGSQTPAEYWPELVRLGEDIKAALEGLKND